MEIKNEKNTTKWPKPRRHLFNHIPQTLYVKTSHCLPREIEMFTRSLNTTKFRSITTL